MDNITTKEMIAIIRTALTATNWHDAQITMSNGDVITISPCGYTKPLTEQTTEYYLMFSPNTPNLGGDTLDIIANQLSQYDRFLAEEAKEKAELRAYFDKYIANGDPEPERWDWYSDWHKDVYGYRPHGIVCGVYVNPHRAYA